MTPKLERFMRDTRPETPYLVVDLDVVRAKHREFVQALPDVRIYYAVKANPASEILALLAEEGCAFDVASVPEVEAVLGAGPERLSFGNTIKKEGDVARAHALGVRLFAIDSEAELRKVARAAPGAKVFCRVLTSGDGADWPLSKKFGCTPDMAFELLKGAAELGVVPHGTSFHVGSQQRDPGRWDAAITTCGRLFDRLRREAGIELRMVNLGGGFPALHREPVPPMQSYGRAIRASLLKHFGGRPPSVIAEPGRSLVGDAGVIESEVVLIAEKGDEDGRRWVYLDVGKFGGLAETMEEAIRYPIETDGDGAVAPVILAGPTCDSADVLYEHTAYELPLDLAIGDRVRIRSAGAYTTSYSAVNFNGIAPLRAYYI